MGQAWRLVVEAPSSVRQPLELGRLTRRAKRRNLGNKVTLAPEDRQ